MSLHRMDKERVFLIVQIGCACFVAGLFLVLAGLFLLVLATRIGRAGRLMGRVSLLGGGLVPVAGIVLGLLSLAAMRGRHFPRPDRRFAKVGLALNLVVALIAFSHPLWLRLFGL